MVCVTTSLCNGVNLTSSFTPLGLYLADPGWKQAWVAEQKEEELTEMKCTPLRIVLLAIKLPHSD